VSGGDGTRDAESRRTDAAREVVEGAGDVKSLSPAELVALIQGAQSRFAGLEPIDDALIDEAKNEGRA